MEEYLDLTPKVIKITWPNDTVRSLFMQIDFGINILEHSYREGYVIALSTEKQREELKSAGFEVEIIFDSMEDYISSSGKE